MAESRLRSSLKRKAIHNIILVIVGFVIVIVLVVMFGTKLLIEFSLLSEKLQGNSDATATSDQQGNAYIAPPTLNPAVDATNSAQIAISGYAGKSQKINLYVNGQLKETTSVDDKNNFTFSSVSLQQGQNTIKAKAQSDNTRKSGDSNILTVTFVKNPPALTIDNPQDGQGFSKSSSPSVSIQGQTDVGANVTVNGSWAIVDDQGRYNYLYTLKDGDNDVKVIATDDAGNQTTKEIHIHTQ